jgi:hypothetical protein
MALVVEIARFPIVLCRLVMVENDGPALQAACEGYVQELQRHRGLFVGVHDWTQADGLGPAAWRLAFERVVQAQEFRHRCVAQAVVVHSPAVRGFATAYSTQQRVPYPVRVSSSLESALLWCQSQLRRSEPLSDHRELTRSRAPKRR